MDAGSVGPNEGVSLTGGATAAGTATGPTGEASAFRSLPGQDELLAAPTPGRENEGERTWIMARRVASSWEEGEQVPEPEPAALPRT